MKATPIVIACALALASAAHAQTGATPAAPGAYTPPDATQAPAAGDGEKGREMLRRAGDATKRTFNRARDKLQGQRQEARDERRDPARTMGAQSTGASAASTTTTADAGSDAARRARMDEAYENWKKSGTSR